MRWPWEKVRWELEGQLGNILRRLDGLETAPPPSAAEGWDEEIAILGARIEAVKAAAAEQLASDAGRAASELGGLRDAVAAIADWQKDIVIAVSEGIERVDRSERRIHAVVKRARRELAAGGVSDAGLEAENAELRLVDGEGGEANEVPDVREEVALPTTGDSSVKGVSIEMLRRARGM